MKIEEGKYYRSRGGRKVGPMEAEADGDFMAPHPDPDHKCWFVSWRPDGTRFDNDPENNLIAEWTDEPDTPTPWKDMTDAEKGALLLAHHRAEAIEFWNCGKWDCDHRFMPVWSDDVAYRVKPDPVVETVTMYTGKPGVDCFGWTADNSPDKRTHRITFTTKDGKPATGTFTNENGDVITMEEL